MDTNTIKNERETSKIKRLVQIGMLSAVAVVLMLFEIPLWFAPSFYKIDLSEIPVLIGAFAMGPVAGITIEFVKIILNLLLNGTMTAGVGEFANFIIGCCFIVPASICYKRKRSRKNAIIGMVLGTLTMIIGGCLMNAFVLLPTYAVAFGMPITSLIEMGSVINPAIGDITTFVIFAVAPFNLIKGIITSLVVALLYKRISRVLK